MQSTEQKQQDLPYFVDKPTAFQDTTDTEVVLDSGECLPVHSFVLTVHSSVLLDMILTDTYDVKGKKRSRPVQSKKILPFPDVTRQEACDFLVAMYRYDRQENMSAAALPSILKIADKFCMRSVLESCDKLMSSQANFCGNGKVQLWVGPSLILIILCSYVHSQKSVLLLAASYFFPASCASSACIRSASWVT